MNPLASVECPPKRQVDEKIFYETSRTYPHNIWDWCGEWKESLDDDRFN